MKINGDDPVPFPQIPWSVSALQAPSENQHGEFFFFFLLNVYQKSTINVTVTRAGFFPVKFQFISMCNRAVQAFHFVILHLVTWFC